MKGNTALPRLMFADTASLWATVLLDALVFMLYVAAAATAFCLRIRSDPPPSLSADGPPRIRHEHPFFWHF